MECYYDNEYVIVVYCISVGVTKSNLNRKLVSRSVHQSQIDYVISCLFWSTFHVIILYKNDNDTQLEWCRTTEQCT